MEKFKKYKNKEDFFSLLFNTRQFAHVKHLQTKSYAQHKALDNFYKEILDLIDTFIETYQGEYGIVQNYHNDIDYNQDPVEYLEEFVKSVKDFRKNLDTHLQNILDEILGLTYQTLYKLKYLH